MRQLVGKVAEIHQLQAAARPYKPVQYTTHTRAEPVTKEGNFTAKRDIILDSKDK